MKTRRILNGILALIGLFILIMDSASVLIGAKDGVTLCLQTVIPSLFPFIFLSNILVKALMARTDTEESNKPLRNQGCILLVGYLAGYPVGAQCAVQAYKSKQVSLQEAQRLAICANNPGPAFIFGIASSLFPQPWAPWAIWSCHLLSSVLLYWLVPSESKISGHSAIPSVDRQPSALITTLRSISIICGWVVIFRVIICILRKWVLWGMPREWSIILCGLLEMTNGCLELNALDCVGVRFALCALFISFGGGCTVIQTINLTDEIKCKGYVQCKLFEGICSFILCYMLQLLTMPDNLNFQIGSVPIIILIGILFITAVTIRKNKNNSRILTSVGV